MALFIHAYVECLLLAPVEVVMLSSESEDNPFPTMKISCWQDSECASSTPSGGKVFTQSPCETMMFSSFRLLPEEDEESSSDLPAFERTGRKQLKSTTYT